MIIWTTVIGQRLNMAENTRSMLLCNELLKRGHDVIMWTSAFDHNRKEWREELTEGDGESYRCSDGLEIRFMRGCGYSQNVSLRRFIDHWLAARDFLRQAPDLPLPDVIVASLPDHITASAAVSYGKHKGIPTIVDIRDKWPDIFIDYTRNRLLSKIIKILLLWESRRTKRALRDADAIVAMMQSMLNWGLAKASRKPTWRERVFFLTTSPKNFDVQQQYLPVDNKVSLAVQAAHGKIIFTFVGTFNRTQHPLLILDAIKYLEPQKTEHISRFAFIIGGDGVAAEEVRRRSALHDNVNYIGWLNPTEINILLSQSNVGLLVMNYPSPAFNNKSFAYLASGLPIINGATGDLAEIIAEERAGINIKAGDPASLADAILTLGSNDQLRNKMAENARRLFIKRFNREINYQDYADHIENIAKVK